MRLARNALIGAALIGLFVVASCGKSETKAAGGPEVKEGQRKVDWAAANQEKGQSGDAPIAKVQGVDAPLPILLPKPPPAAADGAVRVQSVNPDAVKALEDGYYARIPGEKYDLVIQGTTAFFKAPEAGAPLPDTPASKLNFAYGEGEATLSFSRFGADYMMTFHCKGPGQADGKCVTKEEAEAMAKTLIVAR